MDALKQSEANLVVYLHPSKAQCVHDAILGELSSMLFTYNETFEGVVLAYDPIICDNFAKIMPGIEPYFGVRLKAKLLLFNPLPDMLLEGKVVKISRSAISVEILGFAWASIADEDIRDDLRHKTKKKEPGDEETCKQIFVSQSHRKHKIKVGTILRFVVKSFDEEMLHITGSLLADHTGCAAWLDKNLDQSSQADSTSKNRIEEYTGANEEDNRQVLVEKTFLKNDEHVKKLSKRKNDENVKKKNPSKRKKEHS